MSSSLPQDGWQIVLLVDTFELLSSKTEHTPEWLLDALNNTILAESRTLPVGDYLWVARNGDVELVLDCVIERKTRDNLHVSLTQKSKSYPPLTRMDVQELKMINSKVPNKLVVIEGKPHWYGTSKQRQHMLAAYLKKLKERPDFSVRSTKDIHHTVKYLVKKHQEMECETLFNGRLIRNRPHFTFLELKANVKSSFETLDFQWYLKLKRINGLSDAKIQILQQTFPTQEQMANALEPNSLQATRKQIADLKLPGGKRRFGEKLVDKIQAALRDDSGMVEGSAADNNTQNVAETSVFSDDDDDNASEDQSERRILLARRSECLKRQAGVSAGSTNTKVRVVELLDSSDDEKMPAIKTTPNKAASKYCISDCTELVDLIDSSDDEKLPSPTVTPDKAPHHKCFTSNRAETLDFPASDEDQKLPAAKVTPEKPPGLRYHSLESRKRPRAAFDNVCIRLEAGFSESLHQEETHEVIEISDDC